MVESEAATAESEATATARDAEVAAVVAERGMALITAVLMPGLRCDQRLTDCAHMFGASRPRQPTNPPTSKDFLSAPLRPAPPRCAPLRPAPPRLAPHLST